MATPDLYKGRPMSPHLQVYKPQMTSVLSILHRFSGIILFFGSFLWVFWLYAVATDADLFFTLQGFLAQPIGLAFTMSWTFMLFYHLLNGIRHLMWDAGIGLDLDVATKNGIIVIISTILLTALTWFQALIWGELWS